MRRFGSYAATLAVEGGGRAVLCLVAALAGAGSAWLFGVAFIVPSALSAGLGLLAAHRAVPHSPALKADGPPPARMAPAGPVVATTSAAGTGVQGGGDLGRGIAPLALANLLGQLLPNIAPLAVNSRLPASSSAALAFSQAAVAARIPLLVFVPVQVMILPGLSAAAARGDLAAVRARAKQILAFTTGVGLVFALGYVLLGSWGLQTFFGTPEPVAHGLLLVMALSTVVVMAAYTLQPPLVALGGEAWIMAGWAAGSLVTGIVALLPFTVISTAAAGQLVGPALTVALLSGALMIRLRRPPGPAAGGWQADRSVSEQSAALGG
jgi:O-antigen/teichoic acid export membrane protein